MRLSGQGSCSRNERCKNHTTSTCRKADRVSQQSFAVEGFAFFFSCYCYGRVLWGWSGTKHGISLFLPGVCPRIWCHIWSIFWTRMWSRIVFLSAMSPCVFFCTSTRAWIWPWPQARSDWNSKRSLQIGDKQTTYYVRSRSKARSCITAEKIVLFSIRRIPAGAKRPDMVSLSCKCQRSLGRFTDCLLSGTQVR